MNLYDRDDGFRKFTLEQANALLPEVIVRTERAVKLLQKVKRDFEGCRGEDPEGAQLRFDSECDYVLDRWSREIIDLGAYPKGYFTVDFKSPVPDTLFCWTFGEQMISHTHKVYETFKERIAIQKKPVIGFEDSLN